MKKAWAMLGSQKSSAVSGNGSLLVFLTPAGLCPNCIVGVRGELWKTSNFTGHGFPEAGLLCGL